MISDDARRSLRRGVHVLVLVVVLVLVGVFAVQAYPQAVGADHSFVVLSGSMEPSISPGDVVIVTDVPPSTIEANDVITFQRSGTGTPVTHRVLEVEETEEAYTFVTKGDANEDADPGRVPGGNLLGRVAFVLPYVGYVVLFANTNIGTLLLVGVPFGLLVLTELVGLVLSGRDATEDEGAAVEPQGEPLNVDADAGSAPIAEVVNGPTDSPETPADTSAAAGDDFRELEALDGPTDGASSELAADGVEAPDDAIALTTNDLRLSAIAFVSFAAYAAWMAVQDPGGLTIAVAAATGCAVLLVALVYVAGEPEEGPSTTTSGQATDGGVDTALVDDGGDGR